MSKTQDIAIDKIRIDGGTQFRDHTNNAKVQEYAELLAESKGWPFDAPCIVFYDGATYFLVDGFHRYHAANSAKRKKITCQVINGTLREAIKFALSANARHGIYRSNEDKRKAVSFALADEEWSKLSDRAIAEMCGVSHPFVMSMRKEATGNGYQSPSSRTGKDGREYAVKDKPSHPQKVASQDDAWDEIEDPGYDDSAVAVATIDEPEPVVEKKPTKKQSTAEQAVENAHLLQPVQTALNNLLKAMEEVPDVPGMEVFLARRYKIKQMVEPAKGAILATKPHCICPRCGGKGCPQCGNNGWVSSAMNRQLAG